jgi:RES domain-containing protein
MRVWRLVSERHVTSALTGEGAARFGGRWNSVGTRLVYAADSLALATLELAVHLVGAAVPFVALELDVPARLLDHFDDVESVRSTTEATTQALGNEWVAIGNTAALTVPSALVDARSGERNVLLNPLHYQFGRITEVQRIPIEIDRRLA